MDDAVLKREMEQRQEFRSILKLLASDEKQNLLENEDKRNEIYKRLENLYHSSNQNKEFRHFYSDIFITLTNIQNGSDEGSIEVLGQNLYELRIRYVPLRMDIKGKKIDISDNIKKLYDHVSLDIARINYIQKEDRLLSGEAKIVEQQASINRITEKAEGIETEQNALKIEIKKQQEVLQKQQREYIAILGIFAAVVLAFTGGIAFSSSVLENIGKASAYRLSLIVLLIGLVLLNGLYSLFLYVDRLVNGVESSGFKNLFLINVVFIFLICIIIVLWRFGFIEQRNQIINISQSAYLRTSV